MRRAELKALHKQMQRPLPLLQQQDYWVDEFASDALDINDLLGVTTRTHSYYVAPSNEWCEQGIASGDTLIIDHKAQAKHKQLVVAVVDGGLVCKRLNLEENQLQSSVDEAIEMDEYADCHIVGVVSAVIKLIL